MSYNGYANWETWNVMLWLQNEETLWNIFSNKMRIFIRAGALRSDIVYCVKSSYAEMYGGARTPDGVSLENPDISWDEVNATVRSLFDLDEDVDVELAAEDYDSKDSFGRSM